MSEERANAYMLFQPTELFIGTIKKMAKLEIGKGPAILHSINEGLFKDGFINDATYHKFKARYERKLVEVVLAKKVLPHETVQQKQNHGLEKQLLRVARQWPQLSPKSRRYWLRKAQEHADLPAAQQILKASKGGP